MTQLMHGLLPCYLKLCRSEGLAVRILRVLGKYLYIQNDVLCSVHQLRRIGRTVAQWFHIRLEIKLTHSGSSTLGNEIAT